MTKTSANTFHRFPSSFTVLTVLVLMGACLKSLTPMNDAVFVPGAGFSGFWYSFGRIKSLENAKDQNYYCFSAGCLAISAHYLDKDFESVADTALKIQNSWRVGDLSRYSVATEFVDTLLSSTTTDDGSISSSSSSSSDSLSRNGSSDLAIGSDSEVEEEWLSHVNVLTTTWYGGVKISVASNRRELREMLLKTSFIPFATGWGGNRDGELDGGFSLLFHPRCRKGIFLPPTLEMLMNILNVNMGFETVEKLYAEGLKG
mmetsp:Transcript_21839/g.41098  ORF Transcript_21839/g.41098 Transcript_21839/m.41098 type:complete len:259 (+) Transcript_21839:56-832(+)|eukprot:CAMPEP_0182517696 /NCGR_PEP_ID=MMETSP1321-20130603/42756_1 /TAXON_ID=91990 /ORGANISM="Bolidomonas sp., Strain RCC1657" /LENGTH=258 /DNA_ID=CAMNT_0024725457 /DNA_START=57 /DNA_END=833 /DNA_ORIENTATION=+